MNHRCARAWVRTRRTVALAALTLLVVGCGATGSPVDTTTAAPTTTTTITATTTVTGASAPSAAPTSTSVSLPGGLLVTEPPHNAVQPFPAAGRCHARQGANGVLPDPACTPGAVDPNVTDATLESTVCRRGGYTSTVRPPTSVTNSEAFGAGRLRAERRALGVRARPPGAPRVGGHSQQCGEPLAPAGILPEPQGQTRERTARPSLRAPHHPHRRPAHDRHRLDHRLPTDPRHPTTQLRLVSID